MRRRRTRPSCTGELDNDFTPSGWLPPAAPVKAQQLYHGVIKASCRLCHLQLSPEIDFATWDGFAALDEQHRRLIFQEGIMPLSLRAFDRFWFSSVPPNKATLPADPEAPFDPVFFDPANEAASSLPQDQARLLASFLDSIPVKQQRQGPGRPLADAGGDITVAFGTPSVVIDGSASLFAKQFRWEQVSGPTLSLGVTSAPQLELVSANLPAGSYVLRLSVHHGSGFMGDALTTSSDEVRLVVTLGEVSYTEHVHPLWTSTSCTGCHGNGVAVGGLNLVGTPEVVYPRVLDFVNLALPADSLLLRNPAQVVPHGGGKSFPGGIDDPAYQTILQWIEHGASGP